MRESIFRSEFLAFCEDALAVLLDCTLERLVLAQIQRIANRLTPLQVVRWRHERMNWGSTRGRQPILTVVLLVAAYAKADRTNMLAAEIKKVV